MATVAAEGSQEVKHLLSFEDCPELLRGSSLYHILHRGAQIFAQSSGNAATYRLSEQVDHLDVFFSHNWACPRIHKLLCLMLHFNFTPAFCATMAWLVLLLVFTLLGWVPLVSTADESYAAGVLAYFTTLPVFVLFWFSWREIAPSFGSDLRVFLDKTCIHQEDREIQQLGIQKLGAFLCSADSVLVCYTPLYLVKLWTVYEAATFLCLKKVERLHVIPVEMPLVLLFLAIVLYVLNISSMLLRMYLYWENFEMYIAPIFLIVFCILCRRMGVLKAQIRSTLANFRVANCKCFDERDRPVVYRNISLLMHQRFKLPSDTSEEDSLAYFEELVRTLLPIAFERSLGRGTLPFRYLAIPFGLAYISRGIDHLPCLLEGYTFRYWIHGWFCGYINLTFWVLPLCFNLGAWTAAQQVHLRGWRQVLWVLLSALATSVCLIVGYMPVLMCEEAAYTYVPGEAWTKEQDVAFIAILVITVLGVLLGPLFLSGAWRRISRRQPSQPNNQPQNKLRRFATRANSFFDTENSEQQHADEALDRVTVAIAVKVASKSIDNGLVVSPKEGIRSTPIGFLESQDDKEEEAWKGFEVTPKQIYFDHV